MIINKGAVLDGRAQVSEEDVVVAFQNGAGYSASKLIVTSEAPEATDGIIGGVKVRADGAVRVYDATTTPPDRLIKKNGYTITSEGQLCLTTGDAATYSIGGLFVDVDGYIYCDGLNSAAGEGTVISQPADFVGYENVNITGLRINDITVLETTNTTPRRMTFSVLDQIEYTGSRTLTSNTVRPFQDFQYTWNVTYADGSPIPNNEGITVKGEAFNEYTDQRKGNCTVLLREPGSYKVVATVMAANGTGFVRTNTFEYEFTVEASTLPVRWANFNTGDSGNDALDPWGFSLTTASYTNATKRINQTGAFASYDHAAATADARVTYQYNDIYLSGATEVGFPAGLYKIAAKISDDEIELVEALGADYTNVTSSSGPVNTISATFNFDWRITGDYVRTSSLSQLGSFHLIGYGPTKPVLTNSQTNNVVILGGSGGSSSAPANHRNFIGNIVVDGQWTNNPVGTALSSTGSGTLIYVYDDVDFINNRSASCVSLASTSAAANFIRHALVHNCYIDNLYENRFKYTSAGNAAGATTFVVNETIDPATPLTGKIMYLKSDGKKYNASYSSHDGVNTFTTAALPEDSPVNGKVVSSEVMEHNFGLSISSKHPGWNNAVLFSRFSSDGEVIDKDHHIYPDGYLDSLDISYNKFEEGIGLAYAVNTSFSSNIQDYVHKGITLVGNELSDNTRFGFDASKTNNSTDVEWAEELYIAENKSNVLLSFVYYYSTHILRVAHNYDENINGSLYGGRNFKFVHRASFTDNDKFKAVIDQNTVIDHRFIHYTQGEQGVEVTDNITSVEGNNIPIEITTGFLTDANIVTGNNLYAPGATGAAVASISGVGFTLAEFNDAINGVNISENPAGDATAAPDAPTGLTGDAGNAFINWSWTLSATTGVNESIGQRFYRSTTNDFGTSSQIGSDLAAEDTSLNDTGLTNSTTYYGWVTAYNTFGESDPSIVASATPLATGDVYTDNFDRANQAIDDYGEWEYIETASNLDIISNELVLTASGGVRSARALATLTDNQYSEVDTVATGTSIVAYALTRASISAVTFYGARFALNPTTGDATIQLQRLSSGTSTLIGTAVNLTGLTGTNKIRLESEGTTHRIYINEVLRVTETDANIATGFGGIRGLRSAGSDTLKYTNFKCGNI